MALELAQARVGQGAEEAALHLRDVEQPELLEVRGEELGGGGEALDEPGGFGEAEGGDAGEAEVARLDDAHGEDGVIVALEEGVADRPQGQAAAVPVRAEADQHDVLGAGAHVVTQGRRDVGGGGELPEDELHPEALGEALLARAVRRRERGPAVRHVEHLDAGRVEVARHAQGSVEDPGGVLRPVVGDVDALDSLGHRLPRRSRVAPASSRAEASP